MTALAQPTELQDDEFQAIIDIAAKIAGLAIPSTKKSLVQSRISRRMRQVGLTRFADYLAALDDDVDEVNHFIAALTTNVSHFFRENHHFDDLREQHLAGYAGRRLRLWSAGCSNGQEPFSMAIEVMRNIPDAPRHDIRILATDIDANVLAKANQGVYSGEEISGVPEADRAKFFTQLGDDQFQVIQQLRDLVTFRKLNLNGGPWPMKGPFDAIFCRNVMIYFNEETQRALIARFAEQLRTGGSLLLGHSERVHPVDGSGFKPDGITAYRKL